MSKLPPLYTNLSFQKTRTSLNLQKKQPEQDGSDEIWLLTMSDLMMLLMIFFILFFTVSYAQQVNSQSTPVEVKAKHAETVFQAVLPIVHKASKQATAITEVEADLQKKLGEMQEQQGVIVERRLNYIVITFPEQIIFDSGQSELKKSAQPVLQTVADFIDQHPELLLEIQGHTDNRPISTQRYPSNWELSTDRATQVARALVALGIHPVRITTKGFGEYHPVSSNDSEDGRLKNRRVEIQFSIQQPT